jgi:hypothetical protein
MLRLNYKFRKKKKKTSRHIIILKVKIPIQS